MNGAPLFLDSDHVGLFTRCRHARLLSAVVSRPTADKRDPVGFSKAALSAEVLYSVVAGAIFISASPPSLMRPVRILISTTFSTVKQDVTEDPLNASSRPKVVRRVVKKNQARH